MINCNTRLFEVAKLEDVIATTVIFSSLSEDMGFQVWCPCDLGHRSGQPIHWGVVESGKKSSSLETPFHRRPHFIEDPTCCLILEFPSSLVSVICKLLCCKKYPDPCVPRRLNTIGYGSATKFLLRQHTRVNQNFVHIRYTAH